MAIISAANQGMKKRTCKYGIHIPKTVEEAHVFDKSSNKTYWVKKNK